MKQKIFFSFIKLIILCLISLNILNYANAKERTDAKILPYIQSSDPDVLNANLRKTGVDIENGDVWVWGYRGHGLQGNGTKSVSARSAPQKVTYFSDNGLIIVSLVAGEKNIVVLDHKGQVWGWGSDHKYQSSAGNSACAGGKSIVGTRIATPCKIQIPDPVIQITPTRDAVYALTSTGDVYSWGRNRYGEIGNGTKGRRSSLYHIPRSAFGNERIRLIGSAYKSGYAITESGDIYGWGRESMYAFGRVKRKTEYILTPEKLTITQSNGGVADGRNVKYIGGGHETTFLLKLDGTVYGMGKKSKLGLGVSPNDDDNLPNSDDSRCGDEEDDDGDEDDDVDDDGDDIDGDDSVIEACAEDTQDLDSSNTKKTATAMAILKNVKTFYTRYAASVALTNDGEIYTWGYGGKKKKEIYGAYPVLRNEITGKVSKIIGGKKSLIYWNDSGEAYGIGYSRKYKFADHKLAKNINWPGSRLDMVMQAMKNEYGAGFLPGQGASFN